MSEYKPDTRVRAILKARKKRLEKINSSNNQFLRGKIESLKK
jgi:hypothetical protein